MNSKITSEELERKLNRVRETFEGEFGENAPYVLLTELGIHAGGTPFEVISIIDHGKKHFPDVINDLAKQISEDIKAEENDCDDDHCPVHGKIRRG